MLRKIILFFAVVFMTAGVRAETTVATYNAHGAGMHLISATQTIDLRENEAILTTKAQTRGMLSLLLDAETTFLTELDIDAAGECLVRGAKMLSINGKKVQDNVIDFSTCPGYVDYQTGVYDLMRQKAPATRTYNVFDGRRKMRVTFNYQGVKELKPDKRRMYAGPADYYTLYIEVVEGKKKGWFFNRVKDKENPPLHVYFARVKGEERPRLVMAEFETTLFGNISLYLSKVEKR